MNVNTIVPIRCDVGAVGETAAVRATVRQWKLLFGGKRISRHEFESLISHIASPESRQVLRTAKAIYNRKIVGECLRFAPSFQEKGHYLRGLGVLTRRGKSWVAKEIRSRKSPDFNPETIYFRTRQNCRFELIRNRLRDADLQACFREKEPAAIMTLLLQTKAFTEEELLEIWSILGKELNASPYW